MTNIAVGQFTEIDPYRGGYLGAHIAEEAFKEIREAWWGCDDELLRTWLEVCERHIDNGALDTNIAVIVWGYARAALDNPHGHALTIPHDAENFHERTMNEGALTMRRRLFGQ